MVIIVLIGIIIFYITAYFSYQHFDEIFLDKLGTKVIYHDMFKWSQSHHVAVKSDAGLKFAFIACDLCFRYEEVVADSIDVIYLVLMIFYIILMKYYLRHEIANWLWITLGIRILFLGWDAYVLYELLNYNHIYFTEGAGRIIAIMTFSLMIIAIIFEIITSIKCVGNYGKGLRDMINKQNQIAENENPISSRELTENSDT